MENTIPVAPTSTTPVVKRYYAVPVWKFVLLTFVSFLYPTYWFWKNWTLIKEQTGEAFSPLLRSVFSFLYLSDYAKTVLISAKAKQYPNSYDPTVIAWIFFIGILLVLFGYNIGGFAIFSVIPIIQAIAYVNSHTEGASVEIKFNTGELIVGAIGIIFIWLPIILTIFAALKSGIAITN